MDLIKMKKFLPAKAPVVRLKTSYPDRNCKPPALSPERIYKELTRPSKPIRKQAKARPGCSLGGCADGRHTRGKTVIAVCDGDADCSHGEVSAHTCQNSSDTKPWLCKCGHGDPGPRTPGWWDVNTADFLGKKSAGSCELKYTFTV